jgi:probable HAF family extracellular repeat protein
MHDLGTLGGSLSAGNGINKAGQITGTASLAGNSASHAFLFDGTMHDLGTLGGTTSTGNSINDSGRITGHSTLAGNAAYHAFLYDGAMRDLGTLGGLFSSGASINNKGQIAGYSQLPDNLVTHAFVYDGTMQDLNKLIDSSSKWELVYAFGINDAGQITGDGYINGEKHAFLLTPLVCGLDVTKTSTPDATPGFVTYLFKVSNHGTSVSNLTGIDTQLGTIFPSQPLAAGVTIQKSIRTLEVGTSTDGFTVSAQLDNSKTVCTNAVAAPPVTTPPPPTTGFFDQAIIVGPVPPAPPTPPTPPVVRPPTPPPPSNGFFDQAIILTPTPPAPPAPPAPPVVTPTPPPPSNGFFDQVIRVQ